MTPAFATTTLALLGIDWARPWGWWALVVPLLLLVLSRLRARPASLVTGTLFLWRRIGSEERPRGERTRPRPPLALWIAIAGLVLGTFALVGPRFGSAEVPVVWTVVVDHAPSTSLPWLDDDGIPDEEGRSRFERAFAEASDLLSRTARPGDRVQWISSVRADLDLPADERPSADWLAHPAAPAPRPRWSRFDAAGALWVTDRAPAETPEAAGLVAVGGAAVPGPVGRRGANRIDWDGASLVEVPDAIGERRVALAPGVPQRLAYLLRHWAAERGFTVLAPDHDPRGDLALVVECGGDRSATVEVTAGRDGWVLTGPAAPLAERPPDPLCGSWLDHVPVDGAPWTLVEAGPGRVRIAWTDLPTAPAGDPAAFAVSWATLFDDVTLPPRGVVSMADRAAAGEAVSRGPLPPTRRARVLAAAASRADRLDAWLAAGCALLLICALSAGLLRR